MDTYKKTKEINKLLIVDDKLENINAAKKYFSTTNIQVDYASSAKEAITQIQENQQQQKQYDFIITDLEMETPTSGLDVIKEGLRNYTLGTIATGKEATSTHHGPHTIIKPSKKKVHGNKNRPEIWEEIYEKSLDLIIENTNLERSLKRHKEHVGKMDETIIDMFLSTYK